MKAYIHLYTSLALFRSEKSEKADLLAIDLIELLKQFKHSVPEPMLEEIELQLCNHWTTRYQDTRNEDYPLLLHESHLRQVERLYNNEKGVPASQLANILFTGLKLNKIAWAIDLLSWLGPRIMDDKAELIYPILLTHLLFEQKRYAEAAEALPHYFAYGDLNDMEFYSIAAKLDIKIRYEMDCLLDDEYFNMFRATQMNVRRDRSMTPKRREQRNRFFTLVMKLCRAMHHHRHSPQANITKRLQEVQDALHDKNQPVVDTDWLQAKLYEFSTPKTGSK